MSAICVLLLTWGSVAVARTAGGLDDLATIVDRSSHRASSHDRTGGNDDSITSFAPGATHVMLETGGPGRITHMWLTVAGFTGHDAVLRDLVIRMFWEGSTVPSVEVPLGDFFALGHARTYTVRSMPVAVGINPRALNCYWPMPFHARARIEIYNNGRRSVRRIYYNIDYELGAIPPGQGLFHAVFRRDSELRTQAHTANTTGEDNYVILETEGRGHYVGCCLFVDAQPGGWWGEGDEMIFIDHSPRPVIIGTGSEDYFCNAWGFSEPFSYPYYGAPLIEERPDEGKWTSVYRWHIHDPVRFHEHIRVTIEHLFGPDVVNDYSSVAYWYQTEPVRHRDPLPAAEANHPRVYSSADEARPTTFALDGVQLEEGLRRRGIAARAITTSLHEGFHGGGYLNIDAAGESVEIEIPVPQPGTYRVHVKPVSRLVQGSIRLGLKGGEPETFSRDDLPEHKVPHLDLGTVRAREGKLVLQVGGNPIIGIDHLRVEKVPD